MASQDRSLLFTLPESKRPTTARKYHIRRLYDISQLCLQQYDYIRARKAWAILVRCKEVDWKAMWKMGVVLLSETQENEDERNPKKLEYLSTMMLRNPDMRESILQELVLHLIMSGQHRKALDELDLYLPSSPYEDNSALHVYAGLICLYLSQPPETDGKASWNSAMLRDAKQYLERARSLNADDLVASVWLEKIPTLVNRSRQTPSDDEQDEENDNGGSSPIHPKRIRTYSP